MWEEKTCRLSRQWQHWGSGCYQYSCEDGRLNIIVSYIEMVETLMSLSGNLRLIDSQVDNRTFPCYYPGQELRIRLFAQGWLHIGSISCPHCQEICQVRPSLSVYLIFWLKY